MMLSAFDLKTVQSESSSSRSCFNWERRVLAKDAWRLFDSLRTVVNGLVCSSIAATMLRVRVVRLTSSG